MLKSCFLYALLVFSIFIMSLQSDEIALCKFDKENHDAILYVGNTYSENGIAQLQLLLLEGLERSDFVCDIGCGALVGSIPIMSFLDKGCFVGVEPNQWLIEDTLKIKENRDIVELKQPIFLCNELFDAKESEKTFKYIIAHSIISHAARWQLPIFFENCANVLDNGGKVIFSVRLTEPNEYGNLGALEESSAETWAYPGVNFFHYSTFVEEASKWFKCIEIKKNYTEIATTSDSSAFHDWIVLTK